MDFLEKDLETVIIQNYHHLIDRGLDIPFANKNTMLRRQVALGAYGIADLIGLTSDKDIDGRRALSIHVIECKRKKIDMNAYLQAKRYATAVHGIINQFNLKNTNVRVKNILIGREFELSSDFVYALNGDDDTWCFTYHFDYDGMRFVRWHKKWELPDERLEPITKQAKRAIIQLLREQSGEEIHTKRYYF